MFTRNRAAPEQKVSPYVTNGCWPRMRVERSNISENTLPMVMESSLNFEVVVLEGRWKRGHFVLFGENVNERFHKCQACLIK